MYIDRFILSILYQTDDEEKLDNMESEYTRGLVKVILSAVTRYFEDEDIDKPMIKGIVDFYEMMKKDKEEITEEEFQRVYFNAIKAAATTPDFLYLLDKSMAFYNKRFYKARTLLLKKEELQKIDDYLKSQIYEMEEFKDDIHMLMTDYSKNVENNDNEHDKKTDKAKSADVAQFSNTQEKRKSFKI